MPDDDVAARLEQIRGLITERDQLADTICWDDPADVARFNVVQDKIAGKVPSLLDAIEAVLKLADQWDAETNGVDNLSACAYQVQERVRSVLAGDTSSEEKEATHG